LNLGGEKSGYALSYRTTSEDWLPVHDIYIENGITVIQLINHYHSTLCILRQMLQPIWSS